MVFGGGAVIANKHAKELREKFVEKGAINPEKAQTLEELGLTNRPLIQLMILKKHIVKINDKYYFDVEKFDDRAVKQLHDFIVGLFDDVKE